MGHEYEPEPGSDGIYCDRCGIHYDDHDPPPGPEPDYEQIIEDRAADRGPDPEAIMWGGEDIPS